jgi:hypothetical protein
LVEKEEALEKIHTFFQETKEANPSFIPTIKANNMTETTLVSSHSLDISQENFGEFENHTIGIGLKFLNQMGYDGKGIVKRKQGILIPIVAKQRVKHEVIGFDGIEENTMNTKITFVKVKHMVEWFYSS